MMKHTEQKLPKESDQSTTNPMKEENKINRRKAIGGLGLGIAAMAVAPVKDVKLSQFRVICGRKLFVNGWWMKR